MESVPERYKSCLSYCSYTDDQSLQQPKLGIDAIILAGNATSATASIRVDHVHYGPRSTGPDAALLSLSLFLWAATQLSGDYALGVFALLQRPSEPD